MFISVEARVWLATHLLYPNSTQAFDVYQAIVSQSEKAIRTNDVGHLLQKIAQICEKIPAVNSTLAFHVFENKTITEWRLIYKKTQKIQQLIFIGILIFDMKFEEIAKAFKITADKTRFLFHQTFKKVVQQAPEVKANYEFQFKKNSDKTVSYLFTNENLIDYSLGHLSEDDIEKVKIGLKKFPVLQSSEHVYQIIIQQIKNLVSDHASFEIEIPKPAVIQPVVESKTPSQFKNLKKINEYKKPISVSTISIILLVIIFIRPRWIENMSESAKREAVTLLEVTKLSPTVPGADKSSMNLNELPIQSAAKQKANRLITPKENPKPVSAVTEVKPATKPPQAPVSSTEAKKQGGLYRGVLVVTDLDAVTPKVLEKIVSMGGKKAGEVELGWKRTESMGYYHFTLPQDNVDSVNEFLAKFGQYRIEFENHPRLVPAGIKRFIIEVRQSE
ncbi:MAG: hypothetical protein H7328_00405 [Bdellovibrio sp.]|nr:hypothetical protein [Bdellovibrio sp.]